MIGTILCHDYHLFVYNNIKSIGGVRMDKNSKLTDEELNKVNGGMKIVVIKDMKNLSKILPFLFRIKKKEQPSNKEG